MNKLVYVLILVALFSCKSNSIAQEKKTEKTNKPKIERPGFGDPRDNEITNLNLNSHLQIAPDTMRIIAVIQKISSDVNICGKRYKAAILVEIKEIKELGSGIVNEVSSGQKIALTYSNSIVKNFDEPKQEFSKGQEVAMVVKERLCTDMSETAYEIISFRIVN